jgi:hypothetical protein
VGAGRTATRWLAHEVAAEVTQPYVERGARIFVGAWSARDHASNAYGALEVLRRDGRTRTPVAGEWFHGFSDRSAALGQLGADFSALQGDLSLHAEDPADLAWVIAVAVPTLRDWQAFAAKQDGNTLSPWVTEWSVYESWWERLVRLRELARSRGIQLDSPEPVPLPKTVWQRGTTGSGSSTDALFGLLKVTIFGVIALTGVVGFVAIARELHRGLSK